MVAQVGLRQSTQKKRATQMSEEMASLVNITVLCQMPDEQTETAVQLGARKSEGDSHRQLIPKSKAYNDVGPLTDAKLHRSRDRSIKHVMQQTKSKSRTVLKTPECTPEDQVINAGI